MVTNGKYEIHVRHWHIGLQAHETSCLSKKLTDSHGSNEAARTHKTQVNIRKGVSGANIPSPIYLCYATNRKGAGSIPDGVTGIFH